MGVTEMVEVASRGCDVELSVEVDTGMLQERFTGRAVEQIAEVLVPQILEERMKGDYYRRFPEKTTGDAESKAAEGACAACAGDTRMVFENPDKACGMAHVTFEDAISERIVEQIRDVSVEVPQLQFIDKVIDISVVEQRAIHMDRTAQKTTEIRQLPPIEQVVDVPVVLVVQVPQVQVVEETVEIPQLQVVEKIVLFPDDPFITVKGLTTDLINRVQSKIAVMKFDASADKDHFARLQAVITDLITWLQGENLSEAEARQLHSSTQREQHSKQRHDTTRHDTT